MKYLNIILLIFFMACSAGYDLKEGGYRPKKPNFGLVKESFELKDSTLIDFNSIYIKKDIGGHAGPVKIDTGYFFKRFWATGQVFLSHGLLHYPTNEEINNLRSGQIGYYKIKDSVLVTEIFIPWQGGTYDVTYAKIKGDSLIFYERKSGLFFGLTNEKIENSIWIRAKRKNIKLWSKPDW